MFIVKCNSIKVSGVCTRKTHACKIGEVGMVSRSDLVSFSLRITLEKEDKKQFAEALKKLRLSDFKKTTVKSVFVSSLLENIPNVVLDKPFVKINIMDTGLVLDIEKEEKAVTEREPKEYEFDERSIADVSTDFNFVCGMLFGKETDARFSVRERAIVKFPLKKPFIESACVKPSKIARLRTLRKEASFRVEGIALVWTAPDGRESGYIIEETSEDMVSVRFKSDYELSVSSIDINRRIDSLLKETNSILSRLGGKEVE